MRVTDAERIDPYAKIPGRIIMLRVKICTGLLFALAAVSALTAAPESSPDREDPIQVGYVIITPVTEQGEAGVPLEETTGLVAFETFGEKKGNMMTPIGVLPSNMANSAMLFVNTSGRLSRNIGAAIANPAGGSDFSTEITLTLKGENGEQVAQTSLSLEPGKQTAAFVSQMFEKQKDVPKDFTGSLVITSSDPVAMMGLRFRGENFSTLPLTTLGTTSPVPLNGSVGGKGAIILAQFAVGGGWETEIVLSNTAETDLMVRVDLFKPDGTPLVAKLNGESKSSFIDISIPAGGIFILARRDRDGDSEF
jgi:hypothetical protein